MEGHEIFLLILTIGFGIFLLQKMAKSIATVVGITLVISFAYLIFSGQANQLINPGVGNVFEKNDVFFLYDTYCCADCVERERAMCSCFIKPVYDEVMLNIPHSEGQYYEDNRDLLQPLTDRALARQKHDIDHCLEGKRTTRFKIIDDIENLIDFYKKSRELRKGDGHNHGHLRA